MTKYVPKHMSVRQGRAESARMGAVAIRGSRSAVAFGAATALPVMGAGLIAAPAMADEAAQGSASDAMPTLSFGARGDDVVEVQSLMTLVRDGYYGPVTTAAVKDFQAANNLEVDGVVGAKTWAALDKTSTEANAPQGSDDAVLANGDEGTMVRSVQKVLGVQVDGVFGDKTEAAVIDFQKKNDLKVDGVVGPETSYALAHTDAPATSDAKPAPAKKDEAKPAPANKAAAKPAAKKVAPAKPKAPSLTHPGAPYELPFPAGTAYTITQGPFGAASHHKYNDMHAIDFGLPTGASVVAASSGTVYSADYNVTGGNAILIRDASGYCVEYAHLSSMNVYPGQQISQGQNIGYSGATGQGITGPHLHWGIVDCSTLASIKIPDSKELGTTYYPGMLAVSRNGA